jgi:hypothetical protein
MVQYFGCATSFAGDDYCIVQFADKTLWWMFLFIIVYFGAPPSTWDDEAFEITLREQQQLVLCRRIVP